MLVFIYRRAASFSLMIGILLENCNYFLTAFAGNYSAHERTHSKLARLIAVYYWCAGLFPEIEQMFSLHYCDHRLIQVN